MTYNSVTSVNTISKKNSNYSINDITLNYFLLTKSSKPHKVPRNSFLFLIIIHKGLPIDLSNNSKKRNKCKNVQFNRETGCTEGKNLV